MKKSKKEDWYNLAQILAIISGTFIIGAGIYTSLSANYFNLILINNLNSIELNQMFGDLVNTFFKKSNNLFFIGIFFIFCSIGSWIKGYYTR
ncbi:hypothetical protein HYW19_04165 [Candidatus Woesearchaeota archaeon]|nr:hypothetical protein [Candidatus Woesearchaeota archaeon]